MKLRLGIIVCLLVGCTSGQENPPSSLLLRTDTATACEVSASDREWLDRSLEAWHFTSKKITRIGAVNHMTMVVFDAECALTSADAMTGGTADGATFEAVLHEGEVRLPDGEKMPPVVTSFTQADNETAFFVMSLPSVWETGGVAPGPLGLPDLMTAVLLHEGTHVSQFPTYGAQITILSQRERLPESFNDDSVQEQFEDDDTFATSIARETDLFLAAGAASDDEEARRLASRGLDLMQARRLRYFVGNDAYLTEAEDLWLTLEGSGQWVGYAWLVHPDGGNRTENDALAGFGQRSKWWTQNQGHALALALDRLGVDWKPIVFVTADKTIVEMIDTKLTADE